MERVPAQIEMDLERYYAWVDEGYKKFEHLLLCYALFYEFLINSDYDD